MDEGADDRSPWAREPDVGDESRREAAGASPWARDDWVPEPRQPVEFRRPEPDAPSGPPPASTAVPDPASATNTTAAAADGWWSTADPPPPAPPRPTGAGDDDARRKRTLLVGGGAVVLVLLVVATFVRDAGQRGGQAAETTGPDTTEETATTSAPETTNAPTTTPRSTLPPVETVVARAIDAEEGSDPVASFGLVPPDIELLELGKPASWTTWSIPVPAPLDAITTPTEVVLVTRGVIHRVEFPSGTVHSIAIEPPWEDGGYMALAGDAIALSTYGDVMVVRSGDLPTFAVPVGAVSGMKGRPAQGDFLVSVYDENGMNAAPRTLLLTPDTTVTPLDDPWLGVRSLWGEAITPVGELVTSAPGGVYAAPVPGDAAARRLTDGMIVGTGSRHLLVHRCDETLTCRYDTLDVATGELKPTAAPLDVLRDYGFDFPRLSPDGARMALVTSSPQGPPSWMIHDLATGQLDVEFQLESWTNVAAEPWAADGSGVFIVDDHTLHFVAVDGRRAEIDGLGTLTQIAVQPLPVANAAG